MQLTLKGFLSVLRIYVDADDTIVIGWEHKYWMFFKDTKVLADNFLSDPGKPGVWSMGPDITESPRDVLQT